MTGLSRASSLFLNARCLERYPAEKGTLLGVLRNRSSSRRLTSVAVDDYRDRLHSAYAAKPAEAVLQ